MSGKSWLKLQGAPDAVLKTARSRRTALCVMSVLMTVFAGSCLTGCLTPAKTPSPKTASTLSQTNSAELNVSSKPVGTTTARITGAELYSINCNRCHQERYPTERTGAQWKTIMLHMQVRANIPVSQAKLILQYLQENSGR